MEDKALGQIETYSKQVKLEGPVTTNYGAPIGETDAILSVGKHGPVLLQDVAFLEELAHLNRERIPERMVHAKGAGAFGYFEVTHDITKYTAAKVFDTIGKRTKIATRISTVIGGAGSADTVRDPRGFALKFYTEDGIWDLVGNNTPIFFFRDPMFIPSFVHSQKRNPATNLIDPTAIWDLLSLRPETTHQVMYLFGDRGIPNGFRHMNGYGSHAYKFINAQGEAVYCKFHYKTDQGIQNLDVKKAVELTGAEPDYGLKDLYNAIANGNYPSWTMYIQIMTFEQAEKCRFNPFDLTKIWPHGDYPLMPVGKLVFNENPTNYFAQVEQLAFCPAHLIPGIDVSPDKMLAARLFAYADAQRYRLGANYLQLPVNCPFTPVRNYQRDGPMTIHSQSGAVNYHPNSFGGPLSDPRVKKLTPSFKVAGDVYRHDTSNEDDFSQAGDLYRKVLDEPARQRLIENIANNLIFTPEFIQERAVKNFAQVDESFGKRLLAALKLQAKPQ